MNYLFKKKEKPIDEILEDINFQITSSVYVSDKLEGINKLESYIECNSENIYKYCYESLRENLFISHRIFYKLFIHNKDLMERFIEEKANINHLLAAEMKSEEDLTELIMLVFTFRPNLLLLIDLEHLNIFKNEKYNDLLQKNENDEFRKNLVLENFFEFYLKKLDLFFKNIIFLLRNHEFNQNYFIELNWQSRINHAYKNKLLNEEQVLIFFCTLLDLSNKKYRYFQNKIPIKWLYLSIKQEEYESIYKLIYDNEHNLVILLENINNMKMKENIHFLNFLSYIMKIVGDENIMFYENLLSILKKGEFFLQLILIFDYHFNENFISLDLYSLYANEIHANIFLLKEKSKNFVILFTLILKLKNYILSNEETLFINEYISTYRLDRKGRTVISTLLHETMDNLHLLFENIPPLPNDVLYSIRGKILNRMEKKERNSRDQYITMKMQIEKEEKLNAVKPAEEKQGDIFDL